MPQTSRRGRPALTLPPVVEPAEALHSWRYLVLRSWAGRLFLISAGLKVLVAIWRAASGRPDAAAVLSSAATIGLVVSVGFFVWRLFLMIKRRLLWRVRRKLILSYIFIGVIPALLILVFFLFSGSLVFMNVSAYLFKDGYDGVIEDVRVSAQAAATEIGRVPATAQQTLDRVHRIRAAKYPGISLAWIPPGDPPLRAGTWDHMAPPASVPAWLDDTFAGTIMLPSPDPAGDAELVVRSAIEVGPGGRGGLVIVDVPVDDGVRQYLHDTTGVRVSSVAADTVLRRQTDGGDGRSGTSVSLIFDRSVTQIDYRDWRTGETHRATLLMTYRLGELYAQLASAQSILVSGMRLSDAFLLLLIVIGILFLIIEAVALVMGLALARSITSSVHELFMGTERVRQGDFTHRIDIRSRDQLGELADSFNQMTGSIENLLQTAAEKKRLEEELRIARQIQMSLLPRGPVDVRGLGIAALCVPAREVGGDYYDFFPLGAERLGVLIADVSGKGTSAALYMAELKGLVLSLSQIHQSPRQLLIEVNRIISENLDSRSFITMTYAIIDLSAGSMVYARAGHTPMIYVSGDGADARESKVLTPSGMVLGLRIPGASEKFADLLHEDRLTLHPGDVIVLYTDGITEAMNADSDLFGETRLSRIVEEHGHLESGELRERILREIEAFVGAADQHDDMTMILMKVETVGVPAERVAV